MLHLMPVLVSDEGRVRTVTLDRPQARGAVDGEHAAGLLGAFEEFERREDLHVAVLTGSQGHFCAGADLLGLETMTLVPQATVPGRWVRPGCGCPSR
jgi:enoyl-CoA hydratase/carnithine racemase